MQSTHHSWRVVSRCVKRYSKKYFFLRHSPLSVEPHLVCACVDLYCHTFSCKKCLCRGVGFSMLSVSVRFFDLEAEELRAELLQQQSDQTDLRCADQTAFLFLSCFQSGLILLSLHGETILAWRNQCWSLNALRSCDSTVRAVGIFAMERRYPLSSLVSFYFTSHSRNAFFLYVCVVSDGVLLRDTQASSCLGAVRFFCLSLFEWLCQLPGSN